MLLVISYLLRRTSSRRSLAFSCLYSWYSSFIGVRSSFWQILLGNTAFVLMRWHNRDNGHLQKPPEQDFQHFPQRKNPEWFFAFVFLVEPNITNLTNISSPLFCCFLSSLLFLFVTGSSGDSICGCSFELDEMPSSCDDLLIGAQVQTSHLPVWW